MGLADLGRPGILSFLCQHAPAPAFFFAFHLVQSLCPGLWQGSVGWSGSAGSIATDAAARCSARLAGAVRKHAVRLVGVAFAIEPAPFRRSIEGSTTLQTLAAVAFDLPAAECRAAGRRDGAPVCGRDSQGAG